MRDLGLGDQCLRNVYERPGSGIPVSERDACERS